MFCHDGACRDDLSADPKTGMVAVLTVQCNVGDRSAARDAFLKAAREVFGK